MARKDEAYDYVKEKIFLGELKPGIPIMEAEIARVLHMSRTPVREALLELEKEGILVSYPNRGTFVAEITPYDVEEIFELRIMIEEWALRRSISRITDDEISNIRDMFNTAFRMKDWGKMHEADLMLHQLIVDKSGSKRAIAFIKSLNTQLMRIRILVRDEPGRRGKSFEQHIKILDCLRDRDLEKCIQALRFHLKDVANAAIELSKYIAK